MKQYLTLIIFFGLCFTSCSKKELPPPDEIQTPDDPDEDNNNNNNNNNTSFALEVDPDFNAPKGFTSTYVALQPDGKMLIDVVIKKDNIYTYSIYRLDQNGSRDNSFDIDVDKSWLINGITGLHVLTDGKILVGGSFTIAGKEQYLVRLTKEGALDASYEVSDIYLASAPTLHRTGEGKVLLVDRRKQYNSGAGGHHDYISRLNSDGSLDKTFKRFGPTPVSGTSTIASVVPLVGGKILISGYFSYMRDGIRHYDLALLNDDGTYDDSFNYSLEQQRIFLTPLSIAVDAEGRIIIAGSFSRLTDLETRDASYQYDGIARLNGDGTIDPSYKSAARQYPTPNVVNIFTLSDGQAMLRSFDFSFQQAFFDFFNKDGGKSNQELPFPAKSVLNIFREKTDQYLFSGNISLNGQNHPILRLKKK